MREADGTLERPLSPAGAARRAAMLEELTDAMAAVHQRRRVRRRVAAACGWAVLATSAVIAARSQLPGAAGPGAAAERFARAEEAPPAAVVNVEIVETDASILDRWRPAATFTATIIDDDALLSDLADLDRPTGLVRIGDRAYLTAAVTDEELAGRGEL